jgi:hypothetical protein
VVSQVDTTSFTVSSEGVKGVALALSFHHTRRIWKGWDTISGKGGMKIQRGRRRRCTEERPAVGYPSNKKNLEAPLQPPQALFWPPVAVQTVPVSFQPHEAWLLSMEGAAAPVVAGPLGDLPALNRKA